MSFQGDSNPGVDEKSNGVTIYRLIRYLFSLFRPYISIGFAAPFIAGALFAYISLGYSTGPPLVEIIIPILVGFFLGCGFFALDSYFDIETDKFNPRKKSLPHILDSGLLPRWVAIFSTIMFFATGIILSIFVSIIHFILAIIGSFAGVLYTTPPFRFKGRFLLDILINVLAFGVIGSIYGWLIYASFTDLSSVYGWFVVPLCSVLTFIIVFPTPMIDYECDKKANIRSTVVIMGLKNYTKLGIILMSLISVVVALIELKIYFDFNLYSHLSFEFSILMGLILIGIFVFISYFLLYHWPTPRTAFYITGIIAIIVFIGVLVALQMLSIF